MDKRYLIFISSTYEDLKVEREKVTRAIMDLNNIPARMENFPAAGIRPKDLIERVIRECDYFVLIIGSRYGSISDSGKSYTEEEYNYAVHEGIPVIAFIQDGIINNHDDDYKRLLEFKERVKHGTHTIRTWTSPDQLMAIVATSLHNAININPRPGWVRADINDGNTDEINRLREENKILQSHITDFDNNHDSKNDVFIANTDDWRAIITINIKARYTYRFGDIGNTYQHTFRVERNLKQWFKIIEKIIEDLDVIARYDHIKKDFKYYFCEDPFFKRDLFDYAKNHINNDSFLYPTTQKSLVLSESDFSINNVEIEDNDIMLILKTFEDQGLLIKYEVTNLWEITQKGKRVYEELFMK